MAWENCKEAKSKYAMSLIDINSEPPIEQIITLPKLDLDKDNSSVIIQNDFVSKQITSSVVPFFDKDLYTELYGNEPQKRPIGIGNYF